jgi:hypothetical protein
MRKLLSWVVVVGLVCSLAGVASMVLAAPKEGAKTQPTREEIAAALKKVVEENLEATKREDMAAALATIHPKSRTRAMSQRALKEMFAAYQLNYELLSFSYVGRDGEYAVARAKQKTTKISGPAFRDNELDTIHVFKQDGGAWKFWTSANLDVNYLSAAGKAHAAKAGAGKE